MRFRNADADAPRLFGSRTLFRIRDRYRGKDSAVLPLEASRGSTTSAAATPAAPAEVAVQTAPTKAARSVDESALRALLAGRDSADLGDSLVQLWMRDTLKTMAAEHAAAAAPAAAPAATPAARC